MNNTLREKIAAQAVAWEREAAELERPSIESWDDAEDDARGEALGTAASFLRSVLDEDEREG